MLPLIEKEVVSNNWMSLHELVNFVAATAMSIGETVFHIGTKTIVFNNGTLISLGIIIVAVFLLYRKLNPVWVICKRRLTVILSPCEKD